MTLFMKCSWPKVGCKHMCQVRVGHCLKSLLMLDNVAGKVTVRQLNLLESNFLVLVLQLKLVVADLSRSLLLGVYK